jgi:imidazolonepropionase-like amidohydrolase
MRKFRHICILLTLLFAVSTASIAGDVILIKNGTIVPIKGGAPAVGDLLIENGKISRIGENIQAPTGAKVIDATGKFIYPGLVAVMTAVGVTGYPRAGNDTDEVGTATPQMDPYDAINPEDDCIEVTRVGGVTTVQTISGSRSVINGKSVVLHLGGTLAEDMIAKRDVAQIFNMGALEQNKYPSTRPGVVSFLRSKLDEAIQYDKRQGEKGNKNDDEEGREEERRNFSKRMEMEALVPVVNGKVPVIFITNNEVTIRNALSLIEEYNIKGIIRAGSGILRYADRIAKAKIPVIWAGTESVPQRWEPHDLNYNTAAVLAEKGVLFTFDSGGYGPGSRNVRNITRPAAISVAHGLPEKDALEALTINPAKILGIADETGSLEKGKIANVAIWTGSPIQESSRVETVIIKGKLIPMTSFQTRLYDRFRKIVDERRKKK